MPKIGIFTSKSHLFSLPDDGFLYLMTHPASQKFIQSVATHTGHWYKTTFHCLWVVVANRVIWRETGRDVCLDISGQKLRGCAWSQQCSGAPYRANV